MIHEKVKESSEIDCVKKRQGGVMTIPLHGADPLNRSGRKTADSLDKSE